MKTVQLLRSSATNKLGFWRHGVAASTPSSWDTRPMSTASAEEEPFYGKPRPSRGSEPRSIRNRVSIAVHYATTAFADPIRADAVAALGEITGPLTLERLRQQMKAHPDGKRILQDRPIVSKATIPYDRLIAEAPDDVNEPGTTFGQAYGYFLKSHDFDPDERDEVKFVDDEELAYIMLRYRQCHDYWHTLTGLPPSVLGELGLKWLELFQTGLPMAALASTVGALRLSSHERAILLDQYLPWAKQQNQNLSTMLLNVYYEEELDTPLVDLRRRLNIQPAPAVKLED
eukprot:Nitzschia sp. Nitz4//scaffold1_size375055//325377//326312//NITZ4_000332-RA/size375055-augustus-gene-0.733-mRNA-1//-1//CDS//3329541213//5557//frame0